MTNATETISSIAADIATGARTLMDIMGVMDTGAAIDIAAQSFIDDAGRARTRTGIYRYETTRETIEAAMFRGSVARDALDNTYRPSTGPVRDYVMSLIAS